MLNQGPDANTILSPQARRRRNREEMISAILDAARAVMREEGVAALNLQKVARRVGVRAPSLYEYFANKAALYDALFLLGVRLYRERRDRIWDEYEPGWDRLAAAFENYMSFAQEYPELYQLVFERPVPGFVPSETSIEESRKLLATGIQAMTEAMEDRTFIPGLPPERAMDLFLAMMHGLTSLHMANEPHLPVGQGRFGSLIPAAVALFRTSWAVESSKETT
jgi:AcrR family transcriptional regulator